MLLAGCAGGVLPVAAATRGLSPARFERPSTEDIRTETKDILDDPRFTQRVSVWQRLWQWLVGKLGKLRLPDLGMGPVGVVLKWVLIVWCLVTLLAIIGHAAYHIVLASRGARTLSPRFGPDDIERLADHSFSELSAMVAKLAEAGRFRRAIGVMMIALLRWLDDAEVVVFHRSKSNGDYVHEYPPGNGGWGDFCHFVRAFDVAVYGRSRCDRSTYEQMNTLFEQVQDHAGLRP